MNFKGLRLDRIFVAFMLFSSAGAYGTDRSGQDLIEYLLKVAKNKNYLKQKAREMTVGEPTVQKIVLSAMENVDSREIAALMAPSVNADLSRQEMSQCLGFMSSAAGAKLLDAMESNDTAEKGLASLGVIPRSQQDSIRSFFDSSCFKRSIEIMKSKENQDRLRLYGNQVACASIKAEDPAKECPKIF